jgi:hypothetical protein
MRPAFLKVTFDGADIHDLCRDAILEEARIDYALNSHARCTLRYRQTPDKRFPIEDLLGKELAVVAVDESGAEQNIFLGEAIEVELDFALSGAYDLRVEGASRTLRMDLTPRHRSYPPAALREHLKKAAGFSGLDYIENASREELGSEGGLLQIGETDFEFFHRFADLCGCAFRATSNGINLLDHFVDAGCAVEWRAEGGLLDFSLTGRLAPSEFRGWVYDRKKSTSHVETRKFSPSTFGPAGGLIDAAVNASQKDLWRGEVPDPLQACRARLPSSRATGLRSTDRLKRPATGASFQ